MSDSTVLESDTMPEPIQEVVTEPVPEPVPEVVGIAMIGSAGFSGVIE